MHRIFRKTFAAFVIILFGLITGCNNRSPDMLSPITSIQIILPENTGSVTKYIASVLKNRIENRCNVRISENNPADIKLELAVESGIGKEGFRITDGKNRTIRIIGNDEGGLVYGVGKFLHSSHYHQDGFFPTDFRGTRTPRMKVRGMYFATHFYNFYQVAPLEEVQAVIEDMALWGCNSLTLNYDMRHFRGIDDPHAIDYLDRLKKLGSMVKSLGMDVGLVQRSNGGYETTPDTLCAEKTRNYNPSDICPSKPGGLELLAKNQSELFNAFAELDFIWSWPRDHGGCGCKDCQPWGANGFLRCSRQMSRLFHERFPKGAFWLSVWYFDVHGNKNEYDGLMNVIRKQKPDWFDGILFNPRNPVLLEKIDGLSGKDRSDFQYPLSTFLEISMLGIWPWGGWGSVSTPRRLVQELKDVKEATVGGWPYSEGIFEDVNKVIWFQHGWNPDRPFTEVLREYAGYYFNPDQTQQVVELIQLLEKTHKRPMEEKIATESAWQMAQKINSQLPAWSRNSWRWRLLLLRTKIDHILHKTIQEQKLITDEGWNDLLHELKPYFNEISNNYSVTEQTWSAVRPPKDIAELKRAFKTRFKSE